MNLELLLRPFSSDQVKQRKTSLGHTIHYIETHTVIARLNESFDGEWSFKILEHKLLEDVVVVLGELTAGGAAKQQFGTCELNQESEEGIVFSLGDALKAAASDALKKTATLFGVGIQMYGAPMDSAYSSNLSHTAVHEPEDPTFDDNELPDMETEAETKAETEPESEPDQITDLQFAEIIELAKKRKFSQSQVDQRARSRYGRGLADLTQSEAQDIISKLKSK